jgi:hypothetical protein
MPRVVGPTFLTALVAAALVALSGAQALANHVQCGDLFTQDTMLDGDLVDCPGDGIVIGADDIDSPFTTIEANIANRNRDLGIDAMSGVIDAGGNRAAGNGNPLRCVNVLCTAAKKPGR